ncbi:hypothetical protein QFC21_004795 [Naganishia friedmannii]|uniref:Uncharacterized protein n=1 Tax=Naganishia friedmannii TaxID=89922 RepID=A0ACC2VGR2_9TREE|nr:hypothetical protein QFC21_004795 [Naganishia friedmannii]
MYDLSKLQGLDEYQKSTLLKAGFVDASEVLLASPYELNKALKSSNSAEINRLSHDISAAISVQSRTASGLVTFEDEENPETRPEDEVPPGWISTGDYAIDQVLGGGIRRGVLTEIAGESASGKSHFGLQLALTAQLPLHSNGPGGAILLTSERKISFTRLEQIVQSRIGEAESTHDESISPGKPFEARKYLDNVHTMHVTEVDGLEHALAYMVPNIIAVLAQSASIDKPQNGNGIGTRLPVSLIVIDSIGALFRASYDSNQGGLPQRSKMLCVIADRLKYLAYKHNIAVVVINQVSDVFGKPSILDNAPRISRPGSPAPTTTSRDQNSPAPEITQLTMTYKVQSQYFSGQTNTLSKEASLGLVWANAVNVRIMLSRTGRRRPLDAKDLTRRMKRPRTIDGKYRQALEEDTRIATSANSARRDGLTEERPTASTESSWEATLIRRMHIVFSPFAKQQCMDYVILQSGIHSLPSADYHSNTNGDTSVNVPNQSGPTLAQRQDAKEFADDVFDDLGNLPIDFWSSEAFEQMQADVAKE